MTHAQGEEEALKETLGNNEAVITICSYELDIGNTVIKEAILQRHDSYRTFLDNLLITYKIYKQDGTTDEDEVRQLKDATRIGSWIYKNFNVNSYLTDIKDNSKGDTYYSSKYKESVLKQLFQECKTNFYKTLERAPTRSGSDTSKHDDSTTNP